MSIPARLSDSACVLTNEPNAGLACVGYMAVMTSTLMREVLRTSCGDVRRRSTGNGFLFGGKGSNIDKLINANRRDGQQKMQGYSRTTEVRLPGCRLATLAGRPGAALS